MAEKVHRIHTLPDDAPWKGGIPPVGSEEHPRAIRLLDRVMTVQRPVVLAHLRSIRLRHPDATVDEILKILERRYLAAVTTGGAAVGATAVVPGIGTGVTLALSGVETVGFLEATALFAQSVAEVHGLAVTDPDRGAHSYSRSCSAKRASTSCRSSPPGVGSRRLALGLLGRDGDEDASAGHGRPPPRPPQDVVRAHVRHARRRVVHRQGPAVRRGRGGRRRRQQHPRPARAGELAAGLRGPSPAASGRPRAAAGSERLERSAAGGVRRAGNAIADAVGSGARRMLPGRRRRDGEGELGAGGTSEG